MARDPAGRRLRGGRKVAANAATFPVPVVPNRDVTDSTLEEARRRGADYIFSTTMVPPGKDFSFLEHMDAANECKHGALAVDEVKPEGCRCWVAGGAK